jgi:choline kinase
MKEGRSKTLKKIGNQSILNRMISQLGPSAKTTIVVVGFCSKEVVDHVDNPEVVFVENEDFRTDKNIKSCNLGLEQIESGGVVIVEGDAILNDEDCTAIIEKIKLDNNSSFSCTQSCSENTKNRVGCVSDSGHLYLRDQEESADDRMIGVFYLSEHHAKRLRFDQQKIIDTSLNYYYFEPIIQSYESYDMSKLRLSDMSQTVNTAEEYRCAKLALNL